MLDLAQLPAARHDVADLGAVLEPLKHVHAAHLLHHVAHHLELLDQSGHVLRLDAAVDDLPPVILPLDGEAWQEALKGLKE